MHLSRRSRRRLVSRFRNGASLDVLSTEFGLTIGQVRQVLTAAGEDPPAAERDLGGLIDVFEATAS